MPYLIILFAIKIRKESMVRKYHNHTTQTNPWHCEEESQNIYSNKISVRQLKAKQPAVSSSSRWLQNLKGHKSNADQNKDSFTAVIWNRL